MRSRTHPAILFAHDLMMLWFVDRFVAVDTGQDRLLSTPEASDLGPDGVRIGFSATNPTLAGRRGHFCIQQDTYSTLLRSVGTEFKVMQELLRHSSLRSTLDVYTQAITPSKHEAQAAVMSLVLSATGSSISSSNGTRTGD